MSAWALLLLGLPLCSCTRDAAWRRLADTSSQQHSIARREGDSGEASEAGVTTALLPDPQRHGILCGRTEYRPSWLCDPQHVLVESSADAVDAAIATVAQGRLPYGKTRCGDELVSLQVAVALVQSLNVSQGQSAATAASDLADSLYKQWGLLRTECDTGVVLLVSVGDQQVAVRRGEGVRSNFDDGTARLIISQLTQAVRNKQSTGDAVVDAVHRIGRAVADARPQDRWSVMTPAVALGFFAMVVAAVVIVSLFVA